MSIMGYSHTLNNPTVSQRHVNSMFDKRFADKVYQNLCDFTVLACVSRNIFTHIESEV